MWVRGPRLCSQRLQREANLRARLADASRMFRAVGLSEVPPPPSPPLLILPTYPRQVLTPLACVNVKVKPSPDTLEMVADEDFSILTVPSRLLHSRVEKQLRRIKDGFVATIDKV